MSAQLEFEAGQVWTYDTRFGETASRLVICRVEKNPVLGQIVHIHVRGLRLRSPRAPSGFTDRIGHMPYSAETLRGCILELEATESALPKFEDGYQEWRSAFDADQAGVWTLPVKDAIAAMERVMNQ